MEDLIRKSDVLKLIHEAGGCDAADSYDRGWDECANHLYSEVESMKPAYNMDLERMNEDHGRSKENIN